MITGIIRRRGAQWFVDHTTPRDREPQLETVAWKITGTIKRGFYGPAPDLAEGLTVTWDHGRPWQAHEHGNYLVLETEREGTVTLAPFPCPKVRAGIDTRYQDGRWQKYSKREGWITA